MQRYLLVFLLVVIAAACADTQSAKSLPDNPENRTVVAKRYLEVMPPKELLQGVANRVIATLPEANRKIFSEVMNSPEIEKAAYRIMLDSLVKNFTVPELEAMMAFYGSPAGQSAWKKFSPYMNEIMPPIQQEVRKAIAAAQKPPETKEAPATKAPAATKAPPVTKEPAAPKAQPAPPAPKEPKARKARNRRRGPWPPGNQDLAMQLNAQKKEVSFYCKKLT